MSTSQRENERKEKQNQKTRKKQRIMWIIIAVIIVLLVVMKLFELDFSSIGNAISGKEESIVSSVSSGNYPVTLTSSKNIAFGSISGNVYALTDLDLNIISSSNGEVKQNYEHRLANPVIDVNGGYAVLFDQGGTAYSLHTPTDTVYTDKADNSILCAAVSQTGTVALATTSDCAKTTIKVYSKSLDEKFSFDVSYGYVSALAIDSRGTRLAFAAVNSEGAKLKTVVYTMNISDDKPRGEFEYLVSSVVDLQFNSSDVYVVGNDFVSVISSLKKERKAFEQGSISLVSYCYDTSNRLVIAYADFEGSVSDSVAIVKPSGRVSSKGTDLPEIKAITASSSTVSILSGNELISYKSSNFEERQKLIALESYSDIQQMSSKIFVRYQSFVDLAENENKGA